MSRWDGLAASLAVRFPRAAAPMAESREHGLAGGRGILVDAHAWLSEKRRDPSLERVAAHWLGGIQESLGPSGRTKSPWHSWR